jgi:hypothetical protein
LLHHDFLTILGSHPIVEWNIVGFEHLVIALGGYILPVREDINRAYFVSTKTTPYSYSNPPRLKRRSEVLSSIFLSPP